MSKSMTRTDLATGLISRQTGIIAEAAAAIDRESLGFVATATEQIGGCNAELKASTARIERIVGIAEKLISLGAASGVATVDTPFIERAQAEAARIAALFEAALRDRTLAGSDLFDDQYISVPRSDPPQVVTRFTAFTDVSLPAIQGARAGDKSERGVLRGG